MMMRVVNRPPRWAIVAIVWCSASFLMKGTLAAIVKLASYEPVTAVADHAGIAGDQAMIEKYTKFPNDVSFGIASEVYARGGNSMSYADLFLSTPLPKLLAKGTNITGVDRNGTQLVGTAMQDYPKDSTKIGFLYPVKNDLIRYLNCKVGALPQEDKINEGCIKSVGTVSISGFDDSTLVYSGSFNKNARTIQRFSTEADIGFRLDNKLENDYYPFFKPYVEFYDTHDFAHQMAMAGFDGGQTSFGKGYNIDLKGYGFSARAQIAKKATAYINLAHLVQRELYVAFHTCKQNCTTPECNIDALQKLDEAVAYYVGNQLYSKDYYGQGNLAYGLAEMLCPKMATCDHVINGQSRVNKNIFVHLEAMKAKLKEAKCAECQDNVEEIVRLMMIPLIQATLFTAQRMSSYTFPSSSMQAEGAIFSAAILPKVSECSRSAANLIYNNMKLIAHTLPRVDFYEVQGALEEVYQCMGVTCAEIGGVVSEANLQQAVAAGGMIDEVIAKIYVRGAEPCADNKLSAGSILYLSWRHALALMAGALALVWM
ncbi:hypothetical protein ACA910_021214 [Epithemia clementina (nom. ined.)]